MLAIIKLNIEMVGNLVEFYVDQIQSQFWQLPKDILCLKSTYLINVKLSSSEIEVKILFIIKGLLQINANLSFKDLGFLSAAFQMNYLEIVKFLIEMENIDVNERESYNSNTSLITASSIKNEKIALLLINNAKTDINASNYSMKTALTYTVLNGMINIASALATHQNFDPYSSNLNFAFYSSSLDMITSLLYPIKDLDVNYHIIYDGSKISGFDFSLWNSHSYKFHLSAIDISLTKAVQEKNFKKLK